MRKIFNIFTLIFIFLLFFTGCSGEIDKAEDIIEESVNSYSMDNMKKDSLDFNVINFRTSENESLDKSEYIIRNYKDFISYINDYKIIENPFFIGKEKFNFLTSVDADFFKDKAFVVSVFVEDNPETTIKGENSIIKDKIIELFIQRKEAESDINELATRHVFFIFDSIDIENVEEVKVKTTVE